MRRKIEPIELGATLFIPANHKNLKSILKRERLRDLRSIVIDTEDGLHVRDFKEAISQIKDALTEYKQSDLYVFIRPKNIAVLAKLLSMENIDKIDGFILAKFSLENMQEYLELLAPLDFYIMPSIEGKELFDIGKLRLLRDRLEDFREKVLLIRFGAEDMLRQLGIRRSKDIALYDMLAPSQIIANILNVFKIANYQISAPVYPFYSDTDGYVKELKRDLLEGLITKTIIHPSQIEPLEEIYSVSQDEYTLASKILHEDNSVFADDGSMTEVNTQSPWAKNILQRVKYYTLQ
jgi:citrate lyase beta subunit